MGSIDKDNPAEDFYERKHLNSDLICTNFTELSDDRILSSFKVGEYCFNEKLL